MPHGAHLASGIACPHSGETAAVGLAWQSREAQTRLASGGIGPEAPGRSRQVAARR